MEIGGFSDFQNPQNYIPRNSALEGKKKKHYLGFAIQKCVVIWAYAVSEGPDQPDILTVWSGPLLSANRIIGYYKMYQWGANAQDDMNMPTKLHT